MGRTSEYLVPTEREDQVSHLFDTLYNRKYDIDPLTAAFFSLCHRYAEERPDSLKRLDKQTDSLWYQDHNVVGYIMYADLFAPKAGEGNFLNGVRERLDYLEELGITLLHILPALRSSGDAGFAVLDYREIDERLGTMKDFQALVEEAHRRGIRIAFDFVLNHTSDNYSWANAAKEGNSYFQKFYILSEDETKPSWPDTPDIFPEHSPGWWDYVPELNRWVFSTFYKRRPNAEASARFEFAQWDLNYRNPDVLLAMLENLLFLANQGVDVFRLDAVPFLWKEKGTDCQSLPGVHTILKLLRIGLEQVAPRTTFLAEACQPPTRLVEYFGQGDEVHQAYQFTLMPALWHALASGKAEQIKKVLTTMPSPPLHAQWLVFHECHDEVSLQLPSAALARELWSFFQRNSGVQFRVREGQDYPEGVSGTTYTLLGGDERKIALIWWLNVSLGGTPLFYMGEELGVENNESYLDDEVKRSDSRFVKRIALTDKMKARRRQEGTKEARLFTTLRDIIAWRRQHPILALQPELIELDSHAVLAYQTANDRETLLMLANVSDESQLVTLPNGEIVSLQPYQFWWKKYPGRGLN